MFESLETNNNLDQGDLEEHLEQARRNGPHGLFAFLEVVNEKRQKKHRQYAEVAEIARRKSQDFGTPLEEMTWSNYARDRILQTDARLRDLQEEALSSLDQYTYHKNK